MSIYSGLPTREDEKNYNNLLVRLLRTLQEHVLEATNNKISLKFANKYQKIIGKMETYEQHKYLPPKYSTIFSQMLRAIYHSHAKVLGDISSDKKDHLQSVNGRQVVTQNYKPQKYTKYRSEQGLQSIEKVKRYQLHESLVHCRTSQSNRKSHPVLGSSHKFKATPNLKQNKKVELQMQGKQGLEVKKDRCSITEKREGKSDSQSFLQMRKKNIRQKMTYLRDPRKKVPVLNAQKHEHIGDEPDSFDKICTNTRKQSKNSFYHSTFTKNSRPLHLQQL